MPKLQKVLSSIVTFATALSLSGIGMVATAHGAQLTNASITMKSSEPSVNTTHTISFNLATSGNLQEVDLQYATTPSGSIVKPTGLGLGSVAFVPGNLIGSDPSSGWSIDASAAGTGLLKLTRTSAAISETSGATFTVSLSGIANNNESSGCDAVVNSDSCFIRISTEASTGGAIVDSTTITYTVVDTVAVTATVDPILTFTVNGVSGTSLQDTNVGSGTGVTTTTTTLPFGNITVGTPKIAEQQLYTQTNDNNGFNVYGKFITSTNKVMSGIAVTANSISKFTNSGNGTTATWSAPQLFSTPSGTVQNVNSAWLGVRTSDTGVANFNSTGVYGPPDVLNDTGTGQVVMTSTGPNNGTTPIYVSFKIQANAFQPADQYQGTWQYNIVPSY